MTPPLPWIAVLSALFLAVDIADGDDGTDTRGRCRPNGVPTAVRYNVSPPFFFFSTTTPFCFARLSLPASRHYSLAAFPRAYCCAVGSTCARSLAFIVVSWVLHGHTASCTRSVICFISNAVVAPAPLYRTGCQWCCCFLGFGCRGQKW